MNGWTKLVPEIVQSSIWNEPPEVRCVWIAMIATKDKAGNVRGNRASLARLANVSIEFVDLALERFTSPDADSNNQMLDGRRIEPVPGGWHIVSHDLYRAMDYREAEALRKKEYRQKKHEMSQTCPGHVPDCPVSVSGSVSEKGVQGETNKKPNKPIEMPFDSEAFRDAWRAWVDHRKLLRKPMSDRAQRLIIGKLPATESEAIRWIDNAIERGWLGIFDPSNSNTHVRASVQASGARRELYTAAPPGKYEAMLKNAGNGQED